MRRAALDEVGGFAEISITEDMLTSIKIHSKGWSSVYHNENLAFGIAAETIVPFHIQRQRWGIGNWMIFFRANPFLVRGLTLPQRLNYFSSMIYPLEGIQKLIFYITPPVALFSGILPMRALDMNYLIHFVPYFIITIFAFNEMARGYGGQLMLEQQSMGKYFTYLKSMWFFLFTKKRSEFRVTPKGVETWKPVPYYVIIPQVIILLLSFFGVLFAVVAVIAGERQDNFVITNNCFWALYNSGLAMAIIQYDYKKLFQRRSAFRMPDAVLVRFKGEEIYDIQTGTMENASYNLAVADNLTEQGASIVYIGQLPTTSQITVEMMVPGRTITANATVMQLNSIIGNGYPISHLGIKFNELPKDDLDYLTHYIHEAAVVKYMKELSNRYRTYLDRRFMGDYGTRERAYRSLVYLPVYVRQNMLETYCVLKDISATGLLLETAITINAGENISVHVILGSKSIELKGVVVRKVKTNSGDYLEHMYGVSLDNTSQDEVRQLLAISDSIGGFVQG